MSRCDGDPAIEAVEYCAQLLRAVLDAYPTDEALAASRLAAAMGSALRVDPAGAPAALAAAFRAVVTAALAEGEGGMIRMRALVSVFTRVLAVLEQGHEGERPDASA